MTLGSLPFAPKPRPCKQCGKAFVPRTSLHSMCSLRCYNRNQKVLLAVEKHRVKTIKADQQSVYDLIAIADRAFGAFIRERDRLAGYACISSGKPLNWSAGNKVDCGHYRSKGAASHLRYNEENAHAQTKFDNRFRAGNAVDYRIGLITRIGLERVEALENDNGVRQWSKEELRDTASAYRAKLKALKEKGPES